MAAAMQKRNKLFIGFRKNVKLKMKNEKLNNSKTFGKP
jgi:hypothetical protein